MESAFDWQHILAQGPFFFLLCVIIYMYHALVDRVLTALQKNTEAMTQLTEVVKAIRHHD